MQKFKRETQQMAKNAIMDFFISIDDLLKVGLIKVHKFKRETQQMANNAKQDAALNSFKMLVMITRNNVGDIAETCCARDGWGWRTII